MSEVEIWVKASKDRDGLPIFYSRAASDICISEASSRISIWDAISNSIEVQMAIALFPKEAQQ